MKNAFQIVIIVLLAAILGLQTCVYVNRHIDEHDSSTNTDTVFLKPTDRWHALEVPTPVTYRVEVPGAPGQTITIPAVIDSMAIVKDYFTKRHYQDSVKNDSISIFITETAFKNEIINRRMWYKWTAPTMVLKETKTVERQLAFAGVDILGNANTLQFIPSIYIDTRRGMFGAGVDPFANPKIFKASFYGKLKLWKRRVRP